MRDLPTVERYRQFLQRAMSTEIGEELEFDLKWAMTQGWKVAPTESMARLSPTAVTNIVSTLRKAKESHCVALFAEPGYLETSHTSIEMEPPEDAPACYELEVCSRDFEELNREWGLFRFIVTSPKLSWAISCGEGYCLYGGPQAVVEGFLAKKITTGFKDFEAYASLVERNGEGPLHLMMRQYARLSSVKKK